MATVNVDPPGVVSRSAESVPYAAILFPSAARATADAYTSRAFSTLGARALTVYLDVTAVTSTPSLVTTVQYYNPGSDSWVTMATNSAVATATSQVLRIGFDLTAADCVVKLPLYEKMRVIVTHGNTNSATYTVSVHFHL